MLPSGLRAFVAAAKADSNQVASNGGSKNTKSKLAGAAALSAARPSPRTTSTIEAFNCVCMRWSCATRALSCSTSRTSVAPREAASKPSAPVPAKASKQCAPCTSEPNQLNRVSRTRSGVGRKPGWVGTGSLLRFHRPPMMRISPGKAAFLTGAGLDFFVTEDLIFFISKHPL